jgi:hypothetical protein
LTAAAAAAAAPLLAAPMTASASIVTGAADMWGASIVKARG